MRSIVLNIAVATYLAIAVVSDAPAGAFANPVPIVRTYDPPPRSRRRPVLRYLSLVRG